MTALILVHTRALSLASRQLPQSMAKFLHSTFLKVLMTTHFFLSLDLKVVIWEGQSKCTSTSMTWFSSQTITQEVTHSGSTFVFLTRRPENHTGLTSSTWWSPTVCITTEWGLWFTQKRQLKTEKAGHVEALIFAITKTVWNGRTRATTLH